MDRRGRVNALREHRGTSAVQRLVEFAPATGGLALWVGHVDVPADVGARPQSLAPQAPHRILDRVMAKGQRPAPVATDGHTLRYGPGFEALPLLQQTGLVAHEVLHIALRHPQRYVELQQRIGDVDLRLFNTCADAIVNSTLGHLAWLQLAPEAVTLEALLASALGQTPGAEAALLEWDVERLYRAIDDRREAGRDSTQQRPDGQRAARVRLLGANTPIDLIPDAGEPEAPEARAEHEREWHERVLRAHASDGAFSMLRTLLADLPRSRTPWEQLLRTQLARALAPQRELSWSRPSRSYIANQGRSAGGLRMPFEPGYSASRAVPRVAMLVDVSGSIDTPLMDRFAREIEALTRRLETTLVLIVGDDHVRRVEHLPPGRSGLRDVVFEGGGGTDFTPLLEEAQRHHPDIAIVLTDLDGPARFQPRWPVLWAVTEAHAEAVTPFGRKLVLS
jgi:predicted metal-dependent peptidase